MTTAATPVPNAFFKFGQSKQNNSEITQSNSVNQISSSPYNTNNNIQLSNKTNSISNLNNQSQSFFDKLVINAPKQNNPNINNSNPFQNSPSFVANQKNAPNKLTNNTIL